MRIRYVFNAALAAAAVLLLAFIPATRVLAYQEQPPSDPNAPKKGDKKVNPKDGLTYVWIPPGNYTYGCSPGDKQCFKNEFPLRKLTLTRGFWLGQTEVTQRAYGKVTNLYPSSFDGMDNPVDLVTWYDADDYCTAIGGRLPTDAEWEYAARAGSTAARYGNLDEIAWYFGNSDYSTHPVAQKKPNAFGLYDMLGNVVEWTDTWYTTQINQENINPKGPSYAEYKTLRGGGWFDEPRLVRVSYRSHVEPDDTDYNIGFRCVSP